jgi:hypothetical protein
MDKVFLLMIVIGFMFLCSCGGVGSVVGIVENFDNTSLFTYTSLCQDTYASNMDELLNANRKNQFQGYTSHPYLDKIRFVQTDVPIPVNADFFIYLTNNGKY